MHRLCDGPFQDGWLLFASDVECCHEFVGLLIGLSSLPLKCMRCIMMEKKGNDMYLGGVVTALRARKA